MSYNENNESEKYRKIGFGVNDLSESDIAHPDKFYPEITNVVVERLKGQTAASAVTSNEIRRDLESRHSIYDKNVQTRIIYNVINDPRTEASIRNTNPDNTMNYYVNYNRKKQQ